MAWERFIEMFRDEFVPVVEREREIRWPRTSCLSSRRQKMVNEITRMFHERALFFPKHVSSGQVHVSRYLSILKRDIHEFLAKTSYRTLAEL